MIKMIKDSEIMEMIKILMEMPKEKYFRCKDEVLNNTNYLSENESTEWLRKCFSLIEKHRPELNK